MLGSAIYMYLTPTYPYPTCDLRLTSVRLLSLLLSQVYAQQAEQQQAAGQLEGAAARYRACLEAARCAGDAASAGAASHHLGLIHQQWQQWEKALECHGWVGDDDSSKGMCGVESSRKGEEGKSAVAAVGAGAGVPQVGGNGEGQWAEPGLGRCRVLHNPVFKVFKAGGEGH
jgi:hypothetical protein